MRWIYSDDPYRTIQSPSLLRTCDESSTYIRKKINLACPKFLLCTDVNVEGR